MRGLVVFNRVGVTMQVPANSSVKFSEWQKEAFTVSTANCLPRQKAEAYRAYIAKIQYAWSKSDLSDTSAINLFKRDAEKCSTIIDSDKVETSLNNYAESILSQARDQQSYSDKWQSSLTPDNIFRLKKVQDMNELATNFKMPLLYSTDATLKLGNWGNRFCIPGPADLQAALIKLPEANVGQNTNLSSLMKEKDFPSWVPANPVQMTKNIVTAPLLGKKNANVSLFHADTVNSKISGFSNYGIRKESYDRGDKFVQTVYANKRQTMSRHKGIACTSTDACGFKTASEKLMVEQKKHNLSLSSIGSGVKKCLGTAYSRGLHGKFIPPVPKDSGEEYQTIQRKTYGSERSEMNVPSDERLKNIEPKVIELIMSEIMDHGPVLSWDDIAGLEFAKNTIKEIVVWPMLRPDIFTGLRGPPKGILLFGPPGTGKTLIGKCIACQSGATFFSISASSLTSKWVGEGEKMVRSLFTVARCHQPAVIFIDEIDALLSQRGEGEHESSRRIKTEFFVQLDGATTSSDENILVVGATNRPQEIDEAARRRLAKRLYIPLPEFSARKQIVVSLMSRENTSITDQQVDDIVLKADGFSGADMTQLCREAALGPIRSIQAMDISTITPDQVRPIAYIDFQNAFQTVRPSVSPRDLEMYEIWNKTFGCGK